MIKNWFWNDAESRLRAGWRIAIFAILFVFFAVVAQVALRSLLGGLPKGSFLIFPILAVSATAAVFLCRRFLDKQSFRSLGLSWNRVAVKDLIVGFVLSAFMAGLFVVTALGLGLITDFRLVETAAGFSAHALLLAIMTTILVGYWEELVMRGYLLQNMAAGMGLSIAIVISCLLYGLLHAANPNANLLSSAIIVLFGYLRIYGFLTTGLLWLSMGMHIGWNFFQGYVFGFAASGHSEKITVFTHTAVGDNWLTGGSFGPEASVLIIPVIGIALLLMRAWSGHSARNAKKAFVDERYKELQSDSPLGI